MRTRLLPIALLAAVAGASAWLAARAPLGLDYPTDAGPAVSALLAGDLAGYLAAQPLMGSFSVLLRAPFGALAELLGGGALDVYRAGAFPCLLAAGAVGAWLAVRMARRGEGRLAVALVAGLAVLNPATFEALRAGHPEEPLGAALCVAAVLAGLGGRAGWAGVLLGLALATKQWALLAVVPVLVAVAPGARLRTALVAGALAAALTLPLLAAHPGDFVSTQAEAASTPSQLSPASAWWPAYSVHYREVFDGVEDRTLGIYYLPGVLGRVPHPLIVALALPLGLLYLRRRGARPAHDALGLLALLLLLRCLLDPVNNLYYHVPFLLALLAWEARRGGRPALTALSAAMLAITFHHVGAPGRDALVFATYLVWTVPLAGYLGWSVLGPVGWRPRALRLGAPAAAERPAR